MTGPCVLAALLLAPAPLPTPGTTVGPIPADVVATWTRAGALAGWVTGVGPARWEFREGAGEGELPAFRPGRDAGPALARLPDPGVPFALDLSHADAGPVLASLARFRSLRGLVLYGAHVPPEAVRHLADLKGLWHLDLDQA